MVLVNRPVKPLYGWAEEFCTIGVTGTNGKTSTTHLIASAVRAAGHSCLLMTTTGFFLDDERLDLPIYSRRAFFESFEIAYERGCRHAAVETTSHALARGVSTRWRFDCAVFTNLTPEHLDIHGTLDAYRAAKSRLFTNLGPRSPAILNAADPAACFIDSCTPSDARRLWYAASAEELARPVGLRAISVEASLEATRVVLAPSELADALGRELSTRMVGWGAAENALAAAAGALSVGVPPDAVRQGLSRCPPAPCRFEVLSTRPNVVLDNAHKPDSLTRSCQHARTLAADAQLIVVVGASGRKSRLERRVMGERVGRCADVAIVTNDNPGTEPPHEIASDVVAGVSQGGRTLRTQTELDRRTAIEMALAIAGEHDIVLVLGKGMETGQLIGDEVIPYSDRETIAELLVSR